LTGTVVNAREGVKDACAPEIINGLVTPVSEVTVPDAKTTSIVAPLSDPVTLNVVLFTGEICRLDAP
jgi:hypothetical protein